MAQHSDENIFASHASSLGAYGLAVLPAKGKAPLVKNWTKWKLPPTRRTLDTWARQYPDANIAIVPAPSGLFVVDVDTVDQVDEVETLFGKTPLHVGTNRGRHLYYRMPPALSGLPSNLSKLGLKVDLKSGNSIVIAPPSKHESGAVYRHLDAGWDALEFIPQPNLECLRCILQTIKSELKSEQATLKTRYVEGERGIGLNKLLCREAAFCETFDELLDVAQTLNANFYPPLSDAEVIKRARQVWKAVENGNIEPWLGRASVGKTRAEEIHKLLSSGRQGSDAFTLLMFLRTQHGARCSRGKTFAIAAKDMHQAQSLPGWCSKRITAARRILLDAGKIVQITPHQRNTAAQYRFGGENR